MNARLFLAAMNEIDDKYIMEAMAAEKLPTAFRHWRYLHKIAVCMAVAVMFAAFSLGVALAVNADFKQAVITLLFPAYTESQLREIDEGHRTGSFDFDDTLLTFLDKFNREKMLEGVTVKNENGFAYLVIYDDEDSAKVIAECGNPDERLLVIMKRQPYKETVGLWQVVAYQRLDSATANEMIAGAQTNNAVQMN